MIHISRTASDDNSNYQTTIIIHTLQLSHRGTKRRNKFTPDYKANEPIFWHIFKELSKDNNGLVAYDKLQERLISTGKLDAVFDVGKEYVKCLI